MAGELRLPYCMPPGWLAVQLPSHLCSCWPGAAIASQPTHCLALHSFLFPSLASPDPHSLSFSYPHSLSLSYPHSLPPLPTMQCSLALPTWPSSLCRTCGAEHGTSRTALSMPSCPFSSCSSWVGSAEHGKPCLQQRQLGGRRRSWRRLQRGNRPTACCAACN